MLFFGSIKSIITVLFISELGALSVLLKKYNAFCVITITHERGSSRDCPRSALPHLLLLQQAAVQAEAVIMAPPIPPPHKPTYTHIILYVANSLMLRAHAMHPHCIQSSRNKRPFGVLALQS